MPPRQRQPEADIQMDGKQRISTGAHCIKRDETQIEQAGKSDNDVQPHPKTQIGQG